MKNKHIPIFLMALTAAPLLSGCFTTLAMKGMNGPGACPAGIVSLASANMYALQNATPGGAAVELPDPQEKEAIPLNGGENAVEVWYYRTGHELCNFMPTPQPYTMVLVDAQRGRILGVGKEAVAAYRPYMQHSPRFVPSDTSGVLQDLMTPFG